MTGCAMPAFKRISPPTFSHSRAISLIKETFAAKKALLAYLMSSAFSVRQGGSAHADINHFRVLELLQPIRETKPPAWIRPMCPSPPTTPILPRSMASFRLWCPSLGLYSIIFAQGEIRHGRGPVAGTNIRKIMARLARGGKLQKLPGWSEKEFHDAGVGPAAAQEPLLPVVAHGAEPALFVELDGGGILWKGGKDQLVI